MAEYSSICIWRTIYKQLQVSEQHYDYDFACDLKCQH